MLSEIAVATAGGRLASRRFPMPRGKDLKRRVRARMSRTGERYTQAREKVRTISGGAPQGVPGWHLGEEREGAYEAGVDPTDDGKTRAAYLRSVADPGQGFATLMQMVLAERYRGRRLRFAATVRGESVERWAGLWMRIDGPNDEELGFDNMEERRLSGTFDWGRFEVVLDVPVEAHAIAFGVLLARLGQVWLRDVKLEIVSSDVPLTRKRRPIAAHARNLDFSEPA
jgi:hypothetical protein